ncbi:hypothetical protein BDQ17DRAFT_1373127 [Cyathus striatus]|nr:hypothetical protein BDQ17DRAFT_1373127 [Cyathus striatus]
MSHTTPESQHPTNTQKPHSPPATDLKHQTSNNAIGADAHNHRTKKAAPPHHLRTNEALLGAHSPSSMPSSPASIRSISSAIFERDIEPISPPMLSPPNQNPHRIPRARSTEQLEHAVPSVLDSAAAVLASIADEEVEVVAPVNMSVDAVGLSPRSGFASPIGSLRSRTPSIVAPPSPRNTGEPSALSLTSSSSTTSTSPTGTAHVSKRLSFMSYSDLLSSTPATSQPLSSLTTSASTQDPPPHIPTVTQIALSPAGSRPPSIRGRKRDSILIDDVGGEWEREGLGRGLEERLEEAVGSQVSHPPTQPPKA